jgi:multidrug efflux pump subunit AcrB
VKTDHHAGVHIGRVHYFPLPAQLADNLIPILATPISLIGAFFVMLPGWLLPSISLTLLALVLAIGLVVDDCLIIVMENIYTRIEKGAVPPKEAAIKGS